MLFHAACTAGEFAAAGADGCESMCNHSTTVLTTSSACGSDKPRPQHAFRAEQVLRQWIILANKFLTLHLCSQRLQVAHHVLQGNMAPIPGRATLVLRVNM